MDVRKYRMAIDLSVLEHLGVNLYSTVPAVISETVANAWDADASSVSIEIREEGGEKIIIVTDDGSGMGLENINEKFLLVGYQRRVKDGPKTPLGRTPMGRKGIGKLSLFSIADKIEVHTLEENGRGNALLLDHDEIRKQIKKGGGKGEYYPEDIKFDAAFPHKRGTRLVIRGLKKRVNMMTAKSLRKRLARRFGVRCTDAMDIVLIEGDDKGKITMSERDYFGKLEFLFQYDSDYAPLCAHLSDDPFRREFRFGGDGKPDSDGRFRVRGWIGTVHESTSLSVEGDNINKISIMMREKLALEDVLSSFDFRSIFSRYLVGEIYADFLDEGDEDIATSSRQGIIEHDPRYHALVNFLRGEVTNIGSQWNRLKVSRGERDAISVYPKIGEWLDGLAPDARNQARKIFGRINSAALDKEHRKNMVSMGVQAFERYRLMGALDRLEEVSQENLDEFLRLAVEFDDLEASLYYSITEGRLLIIKKLHELTSSDAKERVLQKYLHDHLWLLDPSWERGTKPQSMEQRVTKAFKEVDSRLTKDEKSKLGRVDLQYHKAPGLHVIVELKRASVAVKSGALQDQVVKYRNALEGCLTKQEPVEVVCVLGKYPEDWDTPVNQQRGKNALLANGIRVTTYDTLIDDAYSAYNEYLKAQEEKNRYRRLVKDILGSD